MAGVHNTKVVDVSQFTPATPVELTEQLHVSAALATTAQTAKLAETSALPAIVLAEKFESEPVVVRATATVATSRTPLVHQSRDSDRVDRGSRCSFGVCSAAT